MKTLCLVLALLLAYTSVAYCVSWEEDKRMPHERFREIEAAYKQKILDSQKNKKEAEPPPIAHCRDEEKAKENQRIQTAVNEQMQDMLKSRLNYNE